VTVIEMIARAAERLTAAGVCFGHGTTNAFDEAAWLSLWRLQLALDDLDSVAQRVLTADERAAIDSLIDRRISTRKPAAYLTGEAWLQGVPFFVDERVAVPRSLIAETIADGTLDAWLAPGTRTVLDLCTGSGCLAILAALAWDSVHVDAADLSVDALAVARRNVARHRLHHRITLFQGDALAAVAGRRYDLILCNPPYVNAGSMAALPAEYRAEPALALAGGFDGMDFVRSLLRDAQAHLNDTALLVVEIGHERESFERAFASLQPIWLPTSLGDDQVLLLERQALRGL
jgi:ribosomal protein L3 glutamine methyltransferase